MPGVLAPPSSTALAALPAVVLDLETTGLDVRADRVVQVAAVVMLGPRVLQEPSLDKLVDPGVPIPPAATRVHGVDDAAVSGAPRFAQVVADLRTMLDGHAVVGHHIAFDLAVLRHEAARAGIAWRDPPALDIGLLLAALEPSLTDLSLESVAARVGVEVEARHTARGDAMTAARVFVRLLARLREIDVRTLAEAQSFAARRADLIRREADAHWHSRPADLEQDFAAASAPRIDRYIFERRVQDAMSAPPAMITAQATLHEAAREMTARRIGALLVGGAGRAPEGIVTERDLVRTAADGSRDPTQANVGEIMSAPVQCITADEPLYRALGRMDRGGFRHLCVVDGNGTAVGMLSQRDLLHHRARAALSLGDELSGARDGVALAAAYAKLPVVVERLAAEGVSAIDVARVVSGEVRGLTAQAAQIVANGLAERGRPAPAQWCVLVLGSAGRAESLLSVDQDNALIHAGSKADDAWFAEFGAGLAELLDEVGLPRCKGGVMAANTEWRGSAPEWRERIEGWLQHARPEDLLNVDIFFDLTAVAGNAALARELHASAVGAAAGAPRFVALLARSVSAMTPSLGWFGKLKTDSAGRIDLKRGALLPLVGLARTLALRVGSPELSTPGRLRAAVAAGRLVEADASLLLRFHATLLDLILRQQLVDLQVGVRPSCRVEIRLLGRRSARRLARDLRRLDEMLLGLQDAVAG